ncbi:MAG TPA: S-methyl-5-thioribose-1-phosphate isomerase [Kofleriaceae bacterium]
MKVEGRWRRTIELADDRRSILVLDQARLPYELAWLRLGELAEVARAIRDMHVRGAPLIGATAACGVAIALQARVPLDEACAVVAAPRPTAVNRAWALAEMGRHVAAGVDPWTAAAQICDDDVAQCQAIGRHGLALFHEDRPNRVLTHCNAGWLATVDWGTALAPVYAAHEAGLDVHVWVDETRPRNQGMLTAWELAQHGVPHTVIADNAGGHLMQRGEVDLCIVGTDRTTATGDVCNKIGTYLKALAAHDTGVPFYAAVPGSSIDWTLDDGRAIPIEERSADEVRFVRGTEVVPAGSPVANPAFDVTPRRLVTGLITERGIATPAELRGLYRR